MWEELKKIRYSIQIDEEGYPMFDGFRVNDEGLLKTLFKNLRLYDPAYPKSPLVTTCEGELCFWESFDAPLVAQSVDKLNQEGAWWIFLGGIKYFVTHKEIEEDEWHRLHAWVGPQKIPAVLSRKAQASFLNHLSSAELLKPKAFRMSGKVDQSQKMWDEAYHNKEDGWEIHKHSPVLEHESKVLFQELKTPAKIAVPGSGRGHDAAYLAQQGFVISALDFATTAIEDSKEKYSRLDVQWLQEDVFEYFKNHQKQFDGIFEHTFFCAFPPNRRTEYIKICSQALKPGGYLFGIFFVKTHNGGPPFGLSQWELKQYIEPFFDIKAWHISKHSLTPRLSQELWVVLQAKTQM